VVTRICGELAIRAGQPPLVGELLGGIALGIVVGRFSGTFPILADLTHNEVFIALTDLGIFFIMLLGGIEMRPRKLVESSGGSFIVSVSALLLPLALGFGIGWLFLPESDFRFAQSLFVGTALAITAVPVAIRVLMDLDRLNSRAGQLIISAAVFDDVLSLILLAILTAVIKTGGLPEMSGVVLLVVQAAIFFGITVGIGIYVLPWLGRRIHVLKIDELEFSALIIVALGFALLAEALHMHFILGAFVAGLFFGRRTIDAEIYEQVKSKVSGITGGFLAPVFFASIGMHLELSAMTAIPGFLLLLIFIAFASKLVGAAVPAVLIGFSKRTALAVGIAMSSRGAVELIVADVAKGAGLFDNAGGPSPIVDNMFSAIVIVAIVTTVVVPVGLRIVLGPRPKSKSNGGG
jgi:Kef-type K+ transport system membrane component KefB